MTTCDVSLARRLLLLALLAGASGCLLPERDASTGRRSDDVFEDTQRRIDEAQRLGLPAGNYRIETEHLWLDAQQSEAWGAVLEVASDGVAARAGQPLGAPGVRVGVLAGDARLQLEAALARARLAERSTSFLVTVADVPATLRVGTIDTPIAALYLVPGWPAAVAIAEPRFVGHALEVRVSPAGAGQARLELVPSFSNLGPAGTVSVREWATTLIVPLGVPVLVATVDRAGESAWGTLLARGRGTSSQRGALLVTVTGG